MIAIIRTKRGPEDSPEEESLEYEWAEYNHFAMLMGLASEEEDKLAFIGLALENDPDVPEGSA